ncbi:hypothetical protein SCHPADRAFT_968350 [Schizopora paradoxa]|uniref:Uncharacterized protein n=1 Tax=Schizopora paradoxa TaxID=27342 RepID=A0A0H2RW31_9AGAM|nr:hypothetical protein SCHPADRAFT_968350 [Schizopora paradoxa]
MAKAALWPRKGSQRPTTRVSKMPRFLPHRPRRDADALLLGEDHQPTDVRSRPETHLEKDRTRKYSHKRRTGTPLVSTTLEYARIERKKRAASNSGLEMVLVGEQETKDATQQFAFSVSELIQVRSDLKCGRCSSLLSIEASQLCNDNASLPTTTISSFEACSLVYHLVEGTKTERNTTSLGKERAI